MAPAPSTMASFQCTCGEVTNSATADAFMTPASAFFVAPAPRVGAQVAPDQAQQPLVGDGSAQHAHQHVMIDRVEELRQIDLALEKRIPCWVFQCKQGERK
jgi:hypothetical protein